MKVANILIVEDEYGINNLIKKNLTLVGHECFQLFNGNDVLPALEREHYDLIILDVMLPGESGFDIITKLEKTPVIFLTAKNSLQDRLKGLSLGADDYIVKPFEILELIARVDVVLRRTKGEVKFFEFDDIKIDFTSHRTYKNGTEIELTRKEFDLLKSLVNNRNIALTRERLLELVWGYTYDGDERTVDTHIQRLRKKLGLEERLKTVYKTGYRLEI